MNIEILHLAKGAKQSRGVTVVIDVFRAFTVEPYLYHQQVKEVIAVSEVEMAYALKQQNPFALLCGERNGIMIAGFDFSNSPSIIAKRDLKNRIVIHTTSAGTKGLALAENADVILTGSFVNAQAIADYIKAKSFQQISLVCMGWNGEEEADEDVLCAMYLKSLLEDNPMPDIDEQLYQLQFQAGRRFFDLQLQNTFPEADFWCCIQRNQFDFVIQAERKNGYYLMKKVKVYE